MLGKSNVSAQNRYNYNEDLGFYIDTSEANYLELEDYHSYSFSIYRSSSSATMENLMLSLKADGDYKAIIVSYDITNEELNTLNNNEFIDLEGKITLTSIDFENTSSLLQGRDIEFEGGLFFNSELGYCYNLKYETSQGTGWIIVKEVEVTCPWDEPESIDAGPSTGGGGSGTGGSTGSGSSGGDGGTTSSGTGGSGPGGNNGGTSGGNTSDPSENSDPETICVRDSNGNCINDATAPLTPKARLILPSTLNLQPAGILENWILNIATDKQIFDIFNYINYIKNNSDGLSAIDLNNILNKTNLAIALNSSNFNFEYAFFNRTEYDIDTGDEENNPEGGYDNSIITPFDPEQDTWPDLPNIITPIDFVGWGTPGIRANCMDYAKAQIAKKGYQISDYFNNNNQTIQIYTSANGVLENNVNNAISYLKYALENGIPVIVGVDIKPGSPNPNTDNTTDHFIVTVGMGSDSEGKYFKFFDNASGSVFQGANSENKLYYNSETGAISGNSQTDYAINGAYNPYTLAQVRKSKSL